MGGVHCKGCFSADGTFSEAYLRWLLEHYAATHKIGFVMSNSDQVALGGHLFGAVSKDEAGVMRPCAKLDYGPYDYAEIAASALPQIPNQHAAQRRVKQLVCRCSQPAIGQWISSLQAEAESLEPRLRAD